MLTEWELTKWELTKWELTKWELTKWELTKWGVDKVGVDKVGVDKVGVDEVGIDKVGRYPEIHMSHKCTLCKLTWLVEEALSGWDLNVTHFTSVLVGCCLATKSLNLNITKWNGWT